MTTYTMTYADGRETVIEADSDVDAEIMACEMVGEDAVAADQWDAAGTTESGRQIERLLIWETEEDSANDPGVRAAASLRVTR